MISFIFIEYKPLSLPLVSFSISVLLFFYIIFTSLIANVAVYPLLQKELIDSRAFFNFGSWMTSLALKGSCVIGRRDVCEYIITSPFGIWRCIGYCILCLFTQGEASVR